MSRPPIRRSAAIALVLSLAIAVAVLVPGILTAILLGLAAAGTIAVGFVTGVMAPWWAARLLYPLLFPIPAFTFVVLFEVVRLLTGASLGEGGWVFGLALAGIGFFSGVLAAIFVPRRDLLGRVPVLGSLLTLLPTREDLEVAGPEPSHLPSPRGYWTVREPLLRALREDLDAGRITEEAYASRRESILASAEPDTLDNQPR